MTWPAPGTFACVLVDGDDVSWAVAGVEALVGAGAAQVKPRELEPEKFGGFCWVDLAAPPDGLFAATRALLERLPAR